MKQNRYSPTFKTGFYEFYYRFINQKTIKNMKYVKYAIITIFLILFNFNIQSQPPLTFLEKYNDTALALSKEHNIPASIILGVSMLESGNGTSKLSRNKHNFFGIKKGKYYRGYENDQESFKDFCKLVSKKKYYNSRFISFGFQ